MKSGKMKLEEIQETPPQLDGSVPSSSFSFEADPLLSLSFEKVDSLPVELQNKLRNLQEDENMLMKFNDIYTGVEESMEEIDCDQEKIAKTRDLVRKKVLKMREECLSAKEEEVEAMSNVLLQMNSEFMVLQGDIINLNLRRDRIAQKRVSLLEQCLKNKAVYLRQKEEFLQWVVGKQNANDC